jgi:hypothetical protein
VTAFDAKGADNQVDRLSDHDPAAAQEMVIRRGLHG